MPFHGIRSLLLPVLLIVGIVALVRSAFGVGAHGIHGHGRSRSPGLGILEEG